MSLVIRAMEEADVAFLAQMEKEIFSLPWSEDSFRKVLSYSYYHFLVAEKDGELAGCIGATFLGDEGDIDKVMVAPAYRKQGIADALVRAVFALGDEAEIQAYTLEVRASNRPAISLYEKNGFVSEGVRPDFYEKPTEDALIMWRRPTITMPT